MSAHRSTRAQDGDDDGGTVVGASSAGDPPHVVDDAEVRSVTSAERRRGSDDVVRTGALNAETQSAGRWVSLIRLVRGITEVDPTAMESAARQLGGSRRWLTPVAWAAGTIVLLVHGVKLLVMNWRLSLIQLIPAAWVWLATWDLKAHLLHGDSFAQLTLLERLAVAAAVVAFTVAAFWCNTVFAFAIDAPPPPRITPAVRKTRTRWPVIVTPAVVIGVALAFATVVVPRIAGIWVFSLVLSAVLTVMVISYVAVPARIIGVKSRRLPRKEAIGRAAAGGTLSAVAMAPGYLLGRVGLILLGLQHFHLLGFVMLSIGTALYAAGMSSVKAVKLTMKLTPTVPAAAPAPGLSQT